MRALEKKEKVAVEKAWIGRCLDDNVIAAIQDDTVEAMKNHLGFEPERLDFVID